MYVYDIARYSPVFLSLKSKARLVFVIAIILHFSFLRIVSNTRLRRFHLFLFFPVTKMTFHLGIFRPYSPRDFPKLSVQVDGISYPCDPVSRKPISMCHNCHERRTRDVARWLKADVARSKINIIMKGFFKSAILPIRYTCTVSPLSLF